MYLVTFVLPYLSLTSFTECMAFLSQVLTVCCVGVLQLKEVQSKSSPRLTYVATDDGLSFVNYSG